MDIISGKRFATMEPINKGWSKDKKYCVTDANERNSTALCGVQRQAQIGTMMKQNQDMPG